MRDRTDVPAVRPPSPRPASRSRGQAQRESDSRAYSALTVGRDAADLALLEPMNSSPRPRHDQCRRPARQTHVLEKSGIGFLSQVVDEVELLTFFSIGRSAVATRRSPQVHKEAHRITRISHQERPVLLRRALRLRCTRIADAANRSDRCRPTGVTRDGDSLCS